MIQNQISEPIIQYNRTRQVTIITQLVEIIFGPEAL